MAIIDQQLVKWISTVLLLLFQMMSPEQAGSSCIWDAFIQEPVGGRGDTAAIILYVVKHGR